MIAKCAIVALLAVLATAQPACERLVVPSSGCSSPCGSSVLATSGVSSGESVVLGSSSSSSSSGSSSGAITRNIVAKGKYPVALRNCGPTPDQQIPVTTSRVTAPVQEKPTVRLPASIPAPRTVCHTCTCYKTIVRPRVHQQIITVPTVQRYIETLHKPVVENIQYEAIPVNCEGSQSSGNSGSVRFVSVESGCGSGSQQVQTVEIPSVSGSCGRSVEVSVARPVEVSVARPVEVSRPVEISYSRPVEISRPVEVYSRPVEVAVSRPVEIPVVQSAQRIEIPQTISLGSSSCQC